MTGKTLDIAGRSSAWGTWPKSPFCPMVVVFAQKGRLGNQNLTLYMISRKCCQTRAGGYLEPGEPALRWPAARGHSTQLTGPPANPIVLPEDDAQIVVVAGALGALMPCFRTCPGSLEYCRRDRLRSILTGRVGHPFYQGCAHADGVALRRPVGDPLVEISSRLLTGRTLSSVECLHRWASSGSDGISCPPWHFSIVLPSLRDL